eukprot:161036-Pelagomonas_calceolata.AAC.6
MGHGAWLHDAQLGRGCIQEGKARVECARQPLLEKRTSIQQRQARAARVVVSILLTAMNPVPEVN